jgi:hypothetical protein
MSIIKTEVYDHGDAISSVAQTLDLVLFQTTTPSKYFLERTSLLTAPS